MFENSTVIILTPKAFKKKDDTITISNNDIKGKSGMVLMYADWCGHCHNISGDWDVLANTLNKSSDMRISAFNSSKNETHQKCVSDIGIEGFPTIFYHNKKGDVVAEYNGPRDPKSLLQFAVEQQQKETPKKGPKKGPKGTKKD